MINASNEGIKQHKLGFSTFKLPASTKHILRLTR